MTAHYSPLKIGKNIIENLKIHTCIQTALSSALKIEKFKIGKFNLTAWSSARQRCHTSVFEGKRESNCGLKEETKSTVLSFSGEMSEPLKLLESKVRRRTIPATLKNRN